MFTDGRPSLKEFVEKVVAAQGEQYNAVAMTVVTKEGTYTAVLGKGGLFGVGGIAVDPDSLMLAVALKKFLGNELKIASQLVEQMEADGKITSAGTGFKAVSMHKTDECSECGQCPGADGFAADFAEIMESIFGEDSKK